MADQDLVGLLTGIPTQPIQVSSDPWQRLAQRSREGVKAGASGGRAVGKLFAKLTGREVPDNPMEQLEKLLPNMNPENPDDLTQLAKLQMSSGNPRGAAETIARRNAILQARELEDQENSQRNALSKIAKSKNNDNMIAWLEAGGDVSTAASVLLKQPAIAKPEAFTTMYTEDGNAVRTAVIEGKLVKATDQGWETVPENLKLFGTAPSKTKDLKTTVLTSKKIESYDSLLNLNPNVEEFLTDSLPWWEGGDEVNEDKKLKLYDEAEQIFVNEQPITREDALIKATGLQNNTPSGSDTSADLFPDA
tara:strand:- start:354 stop:1271 length:918 start_codon:yes stop_codon:yes gene_type:complete